MTICLNCFKELSYKNWYKSSQMKSHKICNRCRSLNSSNYRKQYYINNKEKIAIKNFIYRLKQKLKFKEVI